MFLYIYFIYTYTHTHPLYNAAIIPHKGLDLRFSISDNKYIYDRIYYASLWSYTHSYKNFEYISFSMNIWVTWIAAHDENGIFRINQSIQCKFHCSKALSSKIRLERTQKCLCHLVYEWNVPHTFTAADGKAAAALQPSQIWRRVVTISVQEKSLTHTHAHTHHFLHGHSWSCFMFQWSKVILVS